MAPPLPPTAGVVRRQSQRRRQRPAHGRGAAAHHRRNHRDDYNNIVHEAARQHRADSAAAAAAAGQPHHRQSHRGRAPDARDVVHVAHVTLGGSFQHFDVAWQETSRAAHRLQDNLDRSEERSKQLLLCEQSDGGGGELCRMLFKGRRNE